MLFRRREPENTWTRLRTLLWPRRSWRRSFRYLKKRVLRLDATPHAIAAGFAAGVFASFTPFIGFHIFLALALAFLLAGNMAATVLGTAIGNPLTFPFIWGATYELGHLLLYSEELEGQPPVGIGHALWHMDFAAMWSPLVKPMLVGALPIGGTAALISYGALFWAARRFQERRETGLAADGAARRAGLDQDVPRSAGSLS